MLKSWSRNQWRLVLEGLGLILEGGCQGGGEMGGQKGGEGVGVMGGRRG